MTGAAALQDTEQETASARTLKVMTARFGEIEVDPNRVITLTRPFLGFPESRRFVLRPHGENSPFMWLQSLDNPELAFVMINPALITPAYRPDLLSLVREELEVENGRELETLVILSIPSGRIEAMTANLLGPVAINAGKRLAKQVLLDPMHYDPCWPVLGGK